MAYFQPHLMTTMSSPLPVKASKLPSSLTLHPWNK